MSFDWPALRAAWVPGDPFDWRTEGEDKVREYYRVKYQVAAQLQPSSILEIGVRAGYSALAFLQAVPEAEYFGLDLDAGGWGGAKGYLAFARERLRPYTVEFLTCDSQQIHGDIRRRMGGLGGPRTPYAFWHIDGDHSLVGATHDLELAHQSGARWILLDDYDFIPDVRQAGTTFAVKYRREYDAVSVPDGGYRGNLLLTRRDA